MWFTWIFISFCFLIVQFSLVCVWSNFAAHSVSFQNNNIFRFCFFTEYSAVFNQRTWWWWRNSSEKKMKISMFFFQWFDEKTTTMKKIPFWWCTVLLSLFFFWKKCRFCCCCCCENRFTRNRNKKIQSMSK